MVVQLRPPGSPQGPAVGCVSDIWEQRRATESRAFLQLAYCKPIGTLHPYYHMRQIEITDDHQWFLASVRFWHCQTIPHLLTEPDSPVYSTGCSLCDQCSTQLSRCRMLNSQQTTATCGAPNHCRTSARCYAQPNQIIHHQCCCTLFS